MELQECTARKWRRKSRPIKLGRTTSEEEQMEEDPPADTEQESFTTEDKENAQRSDNDGQCQLCNRVFGSKVQLQTHMRLHANGRGLTCDHCGKQYANKSKLKRHSRSHTGEKPYSCSFCSKNFSRSDNLTTHVLRQHQAARVCACAKCYATYITISELKEHRDNCHPGEAVFQCALCDEVKVESGELLTEHLKAMHDDVILKISTEEPMAVDEPLNGTPEKTVTVKSPETDTSGGSGLTKTDNSSNSGSKRKTTTPKKLKLSRYDDSADSVSDYEEVDSPRNSSIERNGDVRDLSLMKHKIYTRKYEQHNGSAANHYEPRHGTSNNKRPRLSNQHHQPPVYVCTKCDVVFNSEDLHNEHNELFHDRSDSPSSYSSKGSIEEEWPNAVSCEICHLLLKNIHYLQRHLQRKHHDGIDYLCPRCPERQATLTGLIDHVRVQHSSGEESHCEECNALFPNKLDLQMHFRQHRVHQCNLCSKQFTMIHKLQRHLRRHFSSSKACTICGQKFANERELGPHVERVHGLPMEAYTQKASERSSDENTTSSVVGSTRYAASRPSMCMTCGKTLPWGMRKLRVSSGEQWANMCKECVDRYQKPKDWLSSIKSERGHQQTNGGHQQQRSVEEEDVADDESSESGISGDESISGKSVHHCGICSISCVSIAKLILHMDSDHHGVDKRHLWDILVETLLAQKLPNPVSSDDAMALYCPPRGDGSKQNNAMTKVLTPLNENKLREDEGRLTVTYNPSRQLALNPSSLVGLASWFTVNAEHGQDVANWVGGGKPSKSGPIQEIIAMDLTSKKCNEESLKSVDDEGNRDEGIVEAKYRCESCPAAFETQENLDAHTRNHEMNAQARCYICNQDMASQTELLKHLMLHRHTSYHCKVCGKSLSSWSKFEAHMGTHDNGAKFACCFCDIQFFDKARLVQHLSDVHDRNDSQICGACGKIYFDHNLLDDHIKEHEDDDLTPPPAVLPIMDSKEGSTQRGRPKLRRMIEDRRKQTDPERSADLFYASPLCPTSFPSSVSAQESRAQTYASSLINRSISDNVGTSQGTQKSLSAKTRDESPLEKQSHVCVYCDKEFSALAKLQRHIRKHTGEKPFRCLYCEMRFSRSDNLHTHMVRRHTEEAERKCQECGDKYHNHSWSQWYQHLRYPGGVPKDMETKKRSRSPAQTICQPQIGLLAAHQATMPSLIPSGAERAEKDERRPRFRAKQRRERELLQLGEVPSLDELGRLLPGVEGAQIHYPFISQSTLFRMGLTVDPSTLLIQHPSSVVAPSVGSRPLSDLPQMVMVQPEALVTKPSQLPNAALGLDSNLLTASFNVPTDNSSEAMESIKIKIESPEPEKVTVDHGVHIRQDVEKVTVDHGVHIRQDVAMLAANALVDLEDQDMDDEEKHANGEAEETLAEVVEDNKDQSEERNHHEQGPINDEPAVADQDLEDDPKDSTDLCIDEQAGQENEEEVKETVAVPENGNGLDQELHEGARESQADGESCESCDDIAIECEFCPLVFDGINNLTDHMITHKNVDPTELNTAIQKVMLCHSTTSPSGANMSEPPALVPPPAESRPVAPPVSGRRHACDQCDKSFTTKQQLAKHAKEHQSREFPFSCTLCEKNFKTTSRLQRHLKTHSGDAPHACTFCGKKFARKDNLKVHVSTAHNGADATQCPKCSKRFETPYALRQHMRWHTDRKYECSVCGTSFTWKCYLVRHMKSRHPEMAEV